MSENPQPQASMAIEVEDLRHRFGSHRALDGVSFTVAEGALHGFVGPNGAGKTTSLKAIATLLAADQGSVRVHGRDVVRSKTAVRRLIGYMPDHFAVYENMLASEYLEFFAAAYGMSRGERRRAVADVLELTDMSGRAGAPIKGLSRGMQQRISLARVLVHDPKVLLLDEPASGLDPRARIELMEILRQLSGMGKTVFISSHILAELADLCDGVTIIDAGQTRYSGSMDDLLYRTQEGRVDYEVLLEDTPETLVESLRAMAGVLAVERDENVESELHISLDPERLRSGALLAKIHSAGLEVREFRRLRRHLDEAFLDLTKPGVRS